MTLFESQIMPLKSGFSLRMENGMVPVSPTGTRAIRPKIEIRNRYKIQNLRLHAAFVNNFRVALIQLSCHYSTVSTRSALSSISNINDSPGR